ncbi:hypothetical protein BZG36_03168 [Bifiguratus adelaidae]|uniref:RNA polymerase II transcription factor B subunit 3 n=1 Tax=Bifiguratus adelaidae TaxID=1938954 RepID=A0A261Y129_9FUNG|nr:hypothetical protein BZG36_03168 [Bifiguratus adelaidae]
MRYYSNTSPVPMGSSSVNNSPSTKILRYDNMNPHIRKLEYAVRGELAIRAEALREKLKKPGNDLPFDTIVNCNIGNPQQLAQKPITFFRQVASLLENTDLLLPKNRSLVEQLYPKDAISRAEVLSKHIGSIGAYSHSQGIPYIRQNVAKFIERRDGYPSDPNNIFLTQGASSGVQAMIQLLVENSSSGIMIPMPQYPLYSATLAMFDAAPVPYYLNEDKDWGLDVSDLTRSVQEARSKGIDVRALVIINPGNPTGQCLSEDNMRDVVQFCHDERIILLADEVYQTNVYHAQQRPFHSFKKILRSMGPKYDNFELVSFHSISKGMIGECGRRGGYFEVTGIDPQIMDQAYKVASISLCPNVHGQVMVDLMTNPPQKGDPSFELYDKEVRGIYESLQRRAKKLADCFNSLEGVTCNEAQGAMYLFPQIRLPERAIKAAQEQGKSPDEFYCLRMLDATGVCVVNGSGFGQVEGTYHFRSTFLPPEELFDTFCEGLSRFHVDFLKQGTVAVDIFALDDHGDNTSQDGSESHVGHDGGATAAGSRARGSVAIVDREATGANVGRISGGRTKAAGTVVRTRNLDRLVQGNVADPDTLHGIFPNDSGLEPVVTASLTQDTIFSKDLLVGQELVGRTGAGGGRIGQVVVLQKGIEVGANEGLVNEDVDRFQSFQEGFHVGVGVVARGKDLTTGILSQVGLIGGIADGPDVLVVGGPGNQGQGSIVGDGSGSLAKTVVVIVDLVGHIVGLGLGIEKGGVKVNPFGTVESSRVLGLGGGHGSVVGGISGEVTKDDIHRGQLLSSQGSVGGAHLSDVSGVHGLDQTGCIFEREPHKMATLSQWRSKVSLFLLTMAAATANYFEDDDSKCLLCGSDKFFQPNLKLLISPCFHKMCESCIDARFSAGPAPCPGANCHQVLRKNEFRQQIFEDLNVEKEVRVRTKVAKIFNKRPEDFKTARAYDDYLEEVEEITFNLINNVDIDETQAKMRQYEQENKDVIAANEARRQNESKITSYQQELERKQKRELREQYMKQIEEEQRIKDAEKQALIRELASSDRAASIIMASRQSQLKRSSALKQHAEAVANARTATPTLPDWLAATMVTVDEPEEEEPELDPLGGYYEEDDPLAIKASYSDPSDASKDSKQARAGGYLPSVGYRRALADAFRGLDKDINDYLWHHVNSLFLSAQKIEHVIHEFFFGQATAWSMACTLDYPLVTLSLTLVEYPPHDVVGYLLAHVTLAPIAIMVVYVAIFMTNRQVVVLMALAGQFCNEWFNTVLKELLRQDRPCSQLGDGYGMPSSHAQFVWFFAIYLSIYTFQQIRLECALWKPLFCVAAAAGASVVSFSRIYLSYHTLPQVAVGALFGSLFAILWYLVTETLRAKGLYQWMVESRLGQFIYLKDASSVDNAMKWEYECWKRERQRLAKSK